jgi:hypothetical protein
MKIKILPVILVLALTTLACNITIQAPKVKTGPEVTTPISESYPDTGKTSTVNLKMGAGSLKISDGSSKMVEGEIKTNISLWQPKIERSNEEVTISQGNNDQTFSFPSGDIVNSWNLKLGTEKPLELNIDAGAYESSIILGSVPLKKLSIDDGASTSKVTFESLNKETMESFKYHTGASQVELFNLANANFKEMDFDSGAGSYTLDFNGKLQQDADVTIKSGLSNMKIIIPSNMDATISLSGGVNNVSLKGTWTVDSNHYRTQSSTGPKLNIDIDMGVGNLELVSQNSNSL